MDQVTELRRETLAAGTKLCVGGAQVALAEDTVVLVNPADFMGMPPPFPGCAGQVGRVAAPAEAA